MSNALSNLLQIGSVNLPVPFQYNDGGRNAAGYASSGDCVIRAIAAAAELPYDEVRRDLNVLIQKQRRGPRSRNPHKDARQGGTKMATIKKYMNSIGWKWVPVMGIATGCTMHLIPSELPQVPQLIARVSKHMVAVVNGTIHDTYDPSRGGTRCVYGYFIPKG